MQTMITNGGAHPADKWADTTAEAILALIQVSDDSATPEALAARQAKRDLRPILFDIFNDHHGAVQGHEQRELGRNAKHVHAKFDPTQHTPDTIAQVEKALAATPYADHFARLEVRNVIRAIINQHTVNVMHIERSWHGDRLHAAKGA